MASAISAIFSHDSNPILSYLLSTISHISSSILRLNEKAVQFYQSIYNVDNLIVEDSKGFSCYLIRKFFQLKYFLDILSLILSFMFLNERVSIFDRCLFCLAVLLNFIKIIWIIPGISCHNLKVSATIDLLLTYIFSRYWYYPYLIIAVVANSITFLTFTFYHQRTCMNLIVAFIISVHNSYIAVQNTVPNGFKTDYPTCITTFFVFYLLCFFISKSYHMVISVYIKKFDEARLQAQNEMKNKSMFVASISHDLKNPINSILGSIDLLQTSQNLTDEDHKELLTVSYSCKILLYLIGNIIDVSKIESGKFDIDWIPMNIAEETNKVVEIEAELSKKKGLPLHKIILSPLPPSVYGDSMRFVQVLINLIGNAIKFTSKGYVAMVLRWANNVEDAKTHEYIKDPNGNPIIIPPETFFKGELPPNSPHHIGSKEQLFIKTHRRKLTEEIQKSPCGADVGEEFSEAVHIRMEKYETLIKNNSPRHAETVESPTLRGFPKVITTSINLVGSHIKSSKSSANIPKMENQSTIEPAISDLQQQIKETNYVFDDGLLVVDIIDTGVGMTEEECGKLFQPFSQANSGIKRQFGGTGLGLWITKQLLMLMNGVIEVQSIIRKGTRFRVIIPFKITHESSKEFTPKNLVGNIPIKEVSSQLVFFNI